MKLTNLIKNNEWLSVEIILWQLYPDEKKNASAYKKVFSTLQLTEPVSGNISVVLSIEHDSFDESEYIDVSGRYNKPEDSINELTNALAIEFTPWNEWLGMNIDENTLQHFTELEIIAHCLYEMTFIGFDEEEIQSELDKLNNVADEFRNMSEEEKKENTISLDDLFGEEEEK